MRTRFYFIIVTLMLMGLVLSACAADTASAQSAPNAQVRTLVVAGQGKSYLTPDIATINIGVHTEGTEVAEAVSRNTAQATKVADALKAAGIDPKDVQTSNFNIYPQQQFGPNGETVSSKYVVDNTVYVTVRDLNQLGALLDAAIKAGANQINGIQFDSTQKEKAIAWFTNPKSTRFAEWQIVNRETMDGVKLYLADIGWVMVRASGTENLLRVYSETSGKETTRRVLTAVKTDSRARSFQEDRHCHHGLIERRTVRGGELIEERSSFPGVVDRLGQEKSAPDFNLRLRFLISLSASGGHKFSAAPAKNEVG